MIKIDIVSLKQYIFENDKIEFILDSIGCHSIQYNQKGYYSAANKDGDNKKAIIVYNDEYLNTTNYTRKITKDKVSTDLLHLVSFNMKCNLKDTVKYLHKILNLPYTFSKKKKEKEVKYDPLDVFKKVKKRRKRVDVKDIEIFNEEVLDEFIPLPHIDLIREGVMPWTCKEFKIGYAPNRKRIVIPHRFWSGSKNDFVGIMGRTIIKEYEMLGLQKYLPLKEYPKSGNIYGLNENFDNICKSGTIVVFEGEKSVLKRHSRGDKTCVSLCCHYMSDEQIRILLSLNVEIVIAMDKDVDINHVRSLCENFYNLRKVSYIWDDWNMLKEKESPADAHDKIYQFMFKNRVAYDEKEHRKYKKYLTKSK